MKLFSILLLVVCAASTAHSENAEVEPFVRWLLDDGERLVDIRFAEVAEAVSGRKVLAVDPEDEVDAAMLQILEDALDAMLADLALPENPIHKVGRVNEISRHAEDFLLEYLNKQEGFECTIPPNASGGAQRSGYPDLRLTHEASGRIFYIDPKVYREGSERSSFRTFYFEPKKATNKILDDASHLIMGIAHSGRVKSRWQLDSWKIVDLIDFRVRLKAEFQASNRDLYIEESVLIRSKK